MGKMMDAYNFVVAKFVRKRKLGRPRHMWEYKMKMELEGRGGTVDGNELSEDRNRWLVIVNAVMNSLRIGTGGW
jgi:hypothetical protein